MQMWLALALLGWAVMTSGAAAQAPVPPTTQGSSADNQQSAFIGVVRQARDNYKNAANEMAKDDTRDWRKDAICKVLGSLQINNWEGTIFNLSSSSEGKGVLEIAIGPDIHIKTWGNAFSDFNYNTLIEPDSPLFKTLSQMHKGARVRFSGQFMAGDTDCIEEDSITQQGSMAEPQFIFQFSSVSPI
jgi:hypothetical protein